MKKHTRIISFLLSTLLVLGTFVIGLGSISASAADGSLSGKWIVDDYGKYMEEYNATFNCSDRTNTSVKINITWKYTIYAGYYDYYTYYFKVNCGDVSTGKVKVVPADTWTKSGAGSARSKTKTASITIPVSTTSATTATLKCCMYQNSGVSDTWSTKVNIPAAATTTTYTVSYNANGGTGAPSSQAKTKGTALTLSSTKPTRTGYDFLGWAESSSATSPKYSAGGSYTSDASVTLYAVWSEISNIYNLGEETYSFKNFSDSDSEGHCFGMSMTSSGYYLDILDTSIIDIASSDKVYTAELNEKTKKPICKYQDKQATSIIKASTVSGGSYYMNGYKDVESDWNDITSYVDGKEYNNNGNLVLVFFAEDPSTGRKGGHAVNFLYYDVVDGQERIYVYDNNFPSLKSYFYQSSDGSVCETPSTFSSSKEIYDLQFLDTYTYFNIVDSVPSSRLIYANEGEINVKGIEGSPMVTGEDQNMLYCYEIPENFTQVTITPLVANAEFEYLDCEYSFGEIDKDTYGELNLMSINGSTEDSDISFIVYNAPSKSIFEEIIKAIIDFFNQLIAIIKSLF